MNGDPATPSTRALSIRVLASVLLASTGAVTPPFLVGGLGFQLQQELGDHPGAMGLAVSAFFVTAGLVAIPMGRRADRMGWARSFRFASIATITGMLGIALLARSWMLLTVMLLVAGLGHSLVMPASNLAVAREFGPRHKGLLFGLKQSASPMGSVLGGLAVPLFALTVGWRWAFVAAVTIPLAGMLLVPPTGSTAAGRKPAPVTRGHTAVMVRLALAGSFGAAVVTALASFLVVSAVDGGLDEGSAGQLLAVGSGVSLASRVLSGWVADRRARVGFGPVTFLLLVGAAGYVVLSVASTPTMVVGSIVAFAAGAGWPGLFHLAIVHHNDGSPAAATGIVQAGLSTGAALGPLTFGLLATWTSYSMAWRVTAMIAVVAALTIWSSGRRLAGVRAVAALGTDPALTGTSAQK